MILKDLVQQRHILNHDILECLEEQVMQVKVAGESMIEYATNIKGHGYTMFISAREEFLNKIDSLIDEIRLCESINTSTHH